MSNIPRRHMPACWTWVRPHAAGLERARQWYINDLTDGTARAADGWEPSPATVRWVYMAKWHRNRCAICGSKVSDRMVRRDHDHDSGLFRGFLCPSCNTWEGVGGSHPALVNYRICHPAIMFNIKDRYEAPSALELVPWHLLPGMDAAA